MLASFPWYDLPSVRWANDSLWQATGYSGALHRSEAVSDHWHDPNLLVTQACGLDLFLSNAPIEPVAVPVFDLDCEAGTYFSYIVGNVNGRVAAVNSLSSRSGWSALLSICTPQRVLVTGSHQASLAALKTGQADVAAIDAVTWSILERDTPADIAGLKIVDRSGAAPSPPYVVRRGTDRDSVFRSLQNAFLSPHSVDSKKALLVKEVIPAERDFYLPVWTEYESLRYSASLHEETLSDRYAAVQQDKAVI